MSRKSPSPHKPLPACAPVRATTVFGDPGLGHTLHCLVIVLGPLDFDAGHLLGELQTRMDREHRCMVVVEPGTEARRWEALCEAVGPERVRGAQVLVIRSRCATTDDAPLLRRLAREPGARERHHLILDTTAPEALNTLQRLLHQVLGDAASGPLAPAPAPLTGTDRSLPRPLARSLTRWRTRIKLSHALRGWVELPGPALSRRAAQWLDAQPGAAALTALVFRLRSLPPGLREREASALATLLSAARSDPALRQSVLALAHDDITHTPGLDARAWNGIRLLLDGWPVTQGRHDDHLPTVIQRARQALRRTELLHIAQERTRHDHGRHLLINRAACPSEVLTIHLTYVAQLELPLKIDRDTTAGERHAPPMPDITRHHLNAAAVRVRTVENGDFTRFLARWAPWVAVMRRLAGDRLAAIEAQRTLPATLSAHEATARHQAARLGLSGQELDDAVGQAIARQAEESHLQQCVALTLALIAEQGQSDLLAPAWPDQVDRRDARRVPRWHHSTQAVAITGAGATRRTRV